MSTDLGYKKYTDFGVSTKGSNPLGSGKWVYAASKSGVDKSTTEKAFNYWQNSDYMKTARYAQGVAGQNLWVDPKNVKPTGPYGQTNGSRGGQFAKYMGKKDMDPFKLARADMINKRKDKYTGFSQAADGSASYWKTKQVKEYRSGPYGNNWSTTKPTGGGGQSSGPYGQKKNPATIGPQSRTRNLHGTRGEKVNGQMLNGAFVEQSVYDQMTDNQRAVYGLNVGQAQARDKTFGVASQIVDAAYQYRRGRSRKKTGLSAAFSAIAPNLLTIAGTAFGGPVGGAIGSAVSTGIQGGGIEDIALDAGKAFVGGKLAGVGSDGLSGGSGIWSGAGSAANNAGPVALSNGGNSVGFFDSLLKGGSDIFSNVGKGFGDIFNGGGTDGLTNFLGGKGGAGQIGDLLNGATGGLTGGIGNALAGLAGGDISQLLAGGFGAYNALNPGGGTPGINPGASGGPGGGRTASPGGYAPGGGSGGGGSGNPLLDLLSGGVQAGTNAYVSGKTADELRDAGKRGADVADPFRHSRNIYEKKLNDLYADPSSLTSMPNFQFGLDQGNKLMQRRADRFGMAGSGNALLEAQQFGSDYSQKYFNDEVSRLATLSGGSGGAMGGAGQLLAQGYRGYADKYGEIAGSVFEQLGKVNQQAKNGQGGNPSAAGQGGSAVDLITQILTGQWQGSGGSGSTPADMGGSPGDIDNPYSAGGAGADNSGGIPQFARLH